MNMIFDGHFRDTVIGVVEELLAEMLRSPHYDHPEKRGGCFTMMLGAKGGSHNLGKHTTLLAAPIGELPTVSPFLYAGIAAEKACRLLDHFIRAVFENSVLSSWQTRNPENDKFGGAILFRLNLVEYYGPFAISFSGLPELADEALMLAVAVRMQWLQKAEAIAIATIIIFATASPAIMKNSRFGTTHIYPRGFTSRVFLSRYPYF